MARASIGFGHGAQARRNSLLASCRRNHYLLVAMSRDPALPEADLSPLRRCRVVLAGSAPSPLDYLPPEGAAVRAGDIVLAPLGPRRLIGVVWDAQMLDAPPVAASRLRPLLRRYDVPPLSPALRQLVAWLAAYYMAPIAQVLRMCLPVAEALEADKPVIEYAPVRGFNGPLTLKRQAALEALVKTQAQGTLADLARMSGSSAAIVRALADIGALTARPVARAGPYPQPQPDFAPPRLDRQQQAAATALAQAVEAASAQPFLLDGVTGSGKTEVYFEAIAQALRMGGQALVLVPEIALTEPWLARFAVRFGAEPVAWHSGQRHAERRRAWRAIADGSARVVVGARSALMLPYAGLKVIIVDEEHEASFKQEEGVLYHARDSAVMRGRLDGCPVVLASATPSLETVQNAAQGRYRTLELPSRFGGAALPQMSAIDMRRHPPDRGRWMSPILHEAVRQTLAQGDQALLFLNRRGYAPLTLCRTCGERIGCPQCSTWLVEHRLTGRLQCHQCGFSQPLATVCPSCQSQDSFAACGPGVERLAEEVAQTLPEAKVALVTSDTITSPQRAAELVAAVESRAVNLLIGTQLVTKGYHFPHLTLVGAVDADLGLAGGDLRAGERTFQQLTQVAGRAGRADKPGRVLLQTHQPENAVLQALMAGDRAGFHAAEAASRERAGMPPFGRLAGIIVSGPDHAVVHDVAQQLARAAPALAGLVVWGPAPAPLARIRGRYRYRLLVRADRHIRVQPPLAEWLTRLRWPSAVRVAVDIDPYAFT